MSVILGPRSPEETWFAPRYTWPSRVTATTTESSCSASGIGVASTLFVRSTLTLFCTIGVITMKTISSTSITSTIGVTLMLELTLAPSFRTASAIYAPWIARQTGPWMSGILVGMRHLLDHLREGGWRDCHNPATIRFT